MIEVITYKFDGNPFHKYGYNFYFKELFPVEKIKLLVKWYEDHKKQTGKFYKYTFTYDKKFYELFTPIFYLPDYLK